MSQNSVFKRSQDYVYPGQFVISTRIGSNVWYYDLHTASYELCEVLESDDHKIRARGTTTNNIYSLQNSDILEVDEGVFSAPSGVRDCTSLKFLTYPNILANLRQRFNNANKLINHRGNIYTYAGQILIAINPYTAHKELYSASMCEKYFEVPLGEEEPHPFAVASSAYDRLISSKLSQYVLISGESGSGKTECTKFVLKYLTWVSQRTRKKLKLENTDDAQLLGSLLLQSNPLLEFFGNARTLRNCNSSRFGKLFKLNYSCRGDRLLSADIDTYLLAKSRVVDVPRGEQNYHVFHSLIYAPVEILEKYAIGGPITSRFLGTEDTSAYGNEKHNFHISVLLETFRTFQFTEETVHSIFNLLFGILYMGQVDFMDTSYSTAASVVDDHPLRVAAHLWGLEAGIETLIDSLTHVQIHDSIKYLSAAESQVLVNSMCKSLYEALFDYIVSMVKQHFKHTRGVTGRGDEREEGPPEQLLQSPCLNVLDFFGFENLENGLEQLCINYANEQLQHHFMHKIAVCELELFISENIVNSENSQLPMHALAYPLSLKILVGTKKELGVFGVLEDCCQLSMGDTQFCAKVKQAIKDMCGEDPLPHHPEDSVVRSAKRRRRCISMDVHSNREFVINHYAEPVTYYVDGFIKRNTDYISNDLRQLLLTSNSKLIQTLFAGDQVAERKKTVCAMFHREMNALINKLSQVSCYFIKCIKPNNSQAEGDFSQSVVLRQLVTGGIGPVLKIISLGYPCRLSYADLYDRFKEVFREPYSRVLSPRYFIELLLQYHNVPLEAIRFGSTKLFMKFGTLDLIEQEIKTLTTPENLERFYSSIVRQYLVNTYKQLCFYAVSVVRIRQCCRKLKKRKEANAVADHYSNVYLPRKKYRAAKVIQEYIRAAGIDRIRFMRIRGAVHTIQRAWRRCQKRQAMIQYCKQIKKRRSRIHESSTGISLINENQSANNMPGRITRSSFYEIATDEPIQNKRSSIVSRDDSDSGVVPNHSERALAYSQTLHITSPDKNRVNPIDLLCEPGREYKATIFEKVEQGPETLATPVRISNGSNTYQSVVKVPPRHADVNVLKGLFSENDPSMNHIVHSRVQTFQRSTGAAFERCHNTITKPQSHRSQDHESHIPSALRTKPEIKQLVQQLIPERPERPLREIIRQKASSTRGINFQKERPLETTPIIINHKRKNSRRSSFSETLSSNVHDRHLLGSTPKSLTTPINAPRRKSLAESTSLVPLEDLDQVNYVLEVPSIAIGNSTMKISMPEPNTPNRTNVFDRLASKTPGSRRFCNSCSQRGERASLRAWRDGDTFLADSGNQTPIFGRNGEVVNTSSGIPSRKSSQILAQPPSSINTTSIPLIRDARGILRLN